MDVKVTFDRINVQNANDIGTVKILMLKGEAGDTVLTPDYAQVEQVITDWLDAHPEAVTTVQDRAVTVQKLASDVFDTIGIRRSASGNVVTMTDAAQNAPVKSIVALIEPLQTGSGDPTPSNIRPLTGWTSCRVYKTGKNLFSESDANWKNNYLINSSGDETSNSSYKYSQTYIRCKPSTLYNIQINKGTSTSVAVSVAYYDANRKFISRYVAVSSTGSTGILNGNFTTPAGAAMLRINVPKNSTTNIQINEGGYKEFANFGSVYTASWAENGVIYGGTYNPIAGTVIKEYAMVEFDGTEDWTYVNNFAFRSSLPIDCVLNTYKGNQSTGWCSHYKVMHGVYGDDIAATDMALAYANDMLTESDYRVYIRDTTYSDATTFAAYLAAQKTAQTPVTLVYKLAEPLTYQVTPFDITTLLELTNIWSEISTTEVNYTGDIETFVINRDKLVEGMIAGIEAKYKATQAYAAGDLLIVEDTLYEAATAIASGADLVVDTNITKTTVAENLGGSLPSAQGVSF